jgi:hypothetical protein
MSRHPNDPYRTVHASVADRVVALLRTPDVAGLVLAKDADLLATALERGVVGEAYYEQNRTQPLYEPLRNLDRFDDLTLSAIALGRRHELAWKKKVSEPCGVLEADVEEAEALCRARGITVGDHQEHAIRVAAHHCRGCGHLEDCQLFRPDCPVGGAPKCTHYCNVCLDWIARLRAR